MIIKSATQTILTIVSLMIIMPSTHVRASAPSGAVNYFLNPDGFLLANWTFNSANDVGTSFSPCITGLSSAHGTISNGSLSSTSSSSPAIDFVDITFNIAQGSIFTLEGVQLGDVKTQDTGSTYKVSLSGNGSFLNTSENFSGYTELSNQYWEFATTAPNHSSTGSITINALTAPQTMTLRIASNDAGNDAGNDAIHIGDVKLYGRATITPVPEPSAMVLLGVALFGVIMRRRPRV